MIFSCKNKEKKMGQAGLAVEVVKLALLGELTDNPKQRASDYPKLLISRLSPYLCLICLLMWYKGMRINPTHDKNSG